MMLGKNELLGWFFQTNAEGMTNGVAEMACQAFLATGTPPVDENGRPSRRMYVMKRVDLLRRLVFVYYNS